MTTSDGEDVHFLHDRSPEPDALPLVISHGWPGSIVEFAEIIGPLADPQAHGGNSADAFHVVAPSIPGLGFSRPTRETGWNLTGSPSSSPSCWSGWDTTGTAPTAGTSARWSRR